MERTLRRLGHDHAYVLPGFFISLVAFVLLVPLVTLALGTAVVWIGVVILPIALTTATLFADLSRRRAVLWGMALEQPGYRGRGPGLHGALRYAADPRRWLDLLFETLIAFPLRTATFAIATTWSALALGGLTYVLWGHFIPRSPDDHRLVSGMLEALTAGAIPDHVASGYLAESVAYFLLGVVFTLTLPPVMRGLALLDAGTTAAALGAAPASGTPGTADSLGPLRSARVA